MAKYRCTVCNYEFEGNLTPDYKCPICRQPASKFVRVEEPKKETADREEKK